MRRAPTAPGREPAQAVAAIGLLALALAAAGVGGVVWTARYDDVLALGRIPYHEEGFQRLPLAITPARFLGLQLGLAALLLLAGAGLVALGPRELLRQLGEEWHRARRRTKARWRQMPARWRWGSAGLLLGLAAVRGWYAGQVPLGTDEVASYDYFVQHGLLAIVSFYPIPNNHIFFNLLAYPLAVLGLPCPLVMRLPTLLVGTAGAVAGYALLARATGLRLATALTALVGLAPLWVYYGAVGRGYFVQFGLLQIGFFSVLELLRPESAYHRLAWLGFFGSSVLGLYTVPTYAYPLAGLLLGGSGGLLAQRRYRRWLELVGAALAILAVAAVLYAPVVAVSGWAQLVANRYVMTRTAAQFWPTFRAVLYESAAALFGPPLQFSGPAWLAGAGLGGLAVWRWVPAGGPRRLGMLAWAMLALPLGLMMAQRVFAPVRTILYVSWFGYVVLALLLRRLAEGRWLHSRWAWRLLMAAILGWGGLRLHENQAQVRAARRETQQLELAFRWLRTQAAPAQRPARVWLHAPLHELFFAHYASLAAPGSLRLHSGSGQGPTGRYDFVVLSNRFASTAQRLAQDYVPAYHDSLVTIFRPRR